MIINALSFTGLSNILNRIRGHVNGKKADIDGWRRLIDGFEDGKFL